MASNIISVDFSDVKESSGINPKWQEEGDYRARITEAKMDKSKAGDPMLVLLFQDSNMRSATYPYYCPLTPKVLWKVRNVFIAAGLQVPKGKGNLNIAKLVNKEVGITLADDEYDGKKKSVIDAVFPADELEPVEADADDAEDDYEDEPDVEVEDDDEEVEEAPVKKSKAKAKKAPEPEPEDEDEDDEEEEEEPAPAPVKKKAKAKAKPVVEEEDDDDLDLDDI